MKAASPAQPQNDPAAAEPLCPEGRLSEPTTFNDGRAIVNIDTYVPFFLASVNNALSRGASAIYRKRFGIGITDWRVISMLAIEPGITAARVCEVVKLDKAATSRALKTLGDAGLLRFVAANTDARRRRWWLSERGYALHDEILQVALRREAELVRGVAPEDLEAFLRVMRRMLRNVERI